ncbi:SMP-30/gluconolactonase/LRE family protein [Cellulomonas citrea]|uniref:SMP-30/gluconolactonase/LRE family protein n=1 Tax=Cellulomonas citrea TaxID=1909423 RepID=UPI001356D77B|nr:SMP-30/gluconolactonase/LRE family protein [Cellulomonas citrea]
MTVLPEPLVLDLAPLSAVTPGAPVPVGSGNDELGEGPLWLADRRELWWVDITGARVHRRSEPAPGSPAPAQLSTWELPRAVGSVLPGPDGRVRLATTHGLEELDPATGELHLLVAIEAELPERRMNDVRVDPAGHVWAGTMRFDTSTGPDDGALYRIDPDGGVHTVLDALACPNGMAWPAPDEMVFIDSGRHRVDRWRLDPVSRQVVGELAPIDLAQFGGLPDGLALLDDGTMWIAFWGEGLVRRLSPDGRVLDQVEVPAPLSSCPALVGADLLVVTTAGGDPSTPPQPSATGPGQVFAVRLPRTLER